MRSTISELVSRYERGTLTRRELIASLTMLAATGTTTSAAGLKVSRLEHVSLQVSDPAIFTRTRSPALNTPGQRMRCAWTSVTAGSSCCNAPVDPELSIIWR